MSLSHYLSFTRHEWAPLRGKTPLTLNESDLQDLRGLNERLDLDEVRDIYLPLSRLLNLYVAASQQLGLVTDTFLGNTAAHVPFIIGIAGSVAVGKSTTARVLRALLARWPNHPKVDLVTTDGFIFPNRVLIERGIMSRKGFPESYDVKRLIEFMVAVKSGEPEVDAPTYSHVAYDIVPGQFQSVRAPNILVVEGLNVLQTGAQVAGKPARSFVSDFFDFSIYIDADEADIERWYVERFLSLRGSVFSNPASYFHKYASLSDADAVAEARRIWREINGLNLHENVLPTRERAQLILEKATDHRISSVQLRKI
ncbi:MAG: type I pantothenate kinase [Vicinamibacteria bacterium]|nr:type I pantothenate kinase [Vicinamibacteria bacterium]